MHASARVPLGVLVLVAATTAGGALAQEVPDARVGPPAPDRNVFLFAGRFHKAWFWDTFDPITLSYEDNYFIGAGTQQFFLDTDLGVTFGVEAGVGARISGSEPGSFEAWLGGVARFGGWDLFDKFHLTPSLTLGLSHVTAPIGVEAVRGETAPKPTDFLVYMAPELAVNTLDNPNLDYFFRIQHRSGGLGLIMSFDGSNAATIGVRLKY